MKLKRLLALGAVVFILILYAATLVFALMDSPHAKNLLMASLFCTIVAPAVLYAYQLILRHLKDRGRRD